METKNYRWIPTLIHSLSLITFAIGLLLIVRTQNSTGLLLLEFPDPIRNIIFTIFALGLVLFVISKILSFILHPHSTQSKPQWRNLISILIAVPIVMGTANQLIIISNQIQTNIGQDLLSISGTGSMYPTFPKGQKPTQPEREAEIVAQIPMLRYPQGFTLGPYKLFDYALTRGDIVSFTNKQTFSLNQGSPSTGFVKRIIGLPQDTLEIKDGIVYLNGQPQKEPYIARARSTFGGVTIQECKIYHIPPNMLVVMGDNRKGSLDSRSELGFINTADVDHVLPWGKQQEYQKNWHDPQNDLSSDSKISLDITNYLKLLNNIRTLHQVKPLVINQSLTKSAQLRGQKILQYNDFSYEATQSAYPIEKSFKDAGYHNIIWGETIIQGYFESQELIENQQAFSNTIEFLLNPDFQEIGIAEVQGQINNCPTQVIVVQFGGYKPPNYAPDVIKSWQQALSNLQSIKPSWQQLTTYPEFYAKNKSNIDRLNELISLRITRTNAIVTRMSQNQWLTDEENSWIRQDTALSQEQSSLAQKINSQ